MWLCCMSFPYLPARSTLCLAVGGTRDGRDLGAFVFNDFAKFRRCVGARDQPAAGEASTHRRIGTNRPNVHADAVGQVLRHPLWAEESEESLQRQIGEARFSRRLSLGDQWASLPVGDRDDFDVSAADHAELACEGGNVEVNSG